MKQHLKLNNLLTPCDFPTDPEDKIKEVRITRFKLKSCDDEFNFIVEVPIETKKTIYDIISKLDNFSNFTLCEACINIEFHGLNQKGNTLLFTLTTLNYDNLEDDKKKIINKYLNRWGLIKSYDCNYQISNF